MSYFQERKIMDNRILSDNHPKVELYIKKSNLKIGIVAKKSSFKAAKPKNNYFSKPNFLTADLRYY